MAIALALALPVLPLTTGSASGQPAGKQDKQAAQEQPSRDSGVGPVRFNAPKGWLRVLEPDRDVRVYSAPTIVQGDEATLIVSVGSVADADDFSFRERFDQFVSLTLKGLEPRKRGAARAGKGAQGLPSLNQELTAENGAGKQTVVKCVAFDLGDRLAGFALLASSEKVFKQFERDFDRLVAGAVVLEEPRRAGE